MTDPTLARSRGSKMARTCPSRRGRLVALAVGARPAGPVAGYGPSSKNQLFSHSTDGRGIVIALLHPDVFDLSDSRPQER